MLKSSTYIPLELSQKQLHQLMNYLKNDNGVGVNTILK